MKQKYSEMPRGFFGGAPAPPPRGRGGGGVFWYVCARLCVYFVWRFLCSLQRYCRA